MSSKKNAKPATTTTDRRNPEFPDCDGDCEHCEHRGDPSEVLAALEDIGADLPLAVLSRVADKLQRARVPMSRDGLIGMALAAYRLVMDDSEYTPSTSESPESLAVADRVVALVGDGGDLADLADIGLTLTERRAAQITYAAGFLRFAKRARMFLPPSRDERIVLSPSSGLSN